METVRNVAVGLQLCTLDTVERKKEGHSYFDRDWSWTECFSLNEHITLCTTMPQTLMMIL